MSFTLNNTIILLLLLSSIFLAIVTVAVLLFLKYRQNHSRMTLFAAGVFAFQTVGIFIILCDAVLGENMVSNFGILIQPSHLFIGMFQLFALNLYSFEAKWPGWINVRKALLISSPLILTAVPALFIHSIELHSIDEIIENIASPDVALRLFICLLYILYPTLILIVPGNWRKCQLSGRVIVMLQAINISCCVCFILGLNLGFFLFAIADFIFIQMMNVVMGVIEFKIRIDNDESTEVAEPVCSVETDAFFDNPDIWMNPEMTAVQLSRLMGTNRTYLAEKIQSMGYSSFNDMINRKRVKYICDKLSQKKPGDSQNVTQLMFDAGFRSRSTASNEFKKITGMTTTEYVKSLN